MNDIPVGTSGCMGKITTSNRTSEFRSYFIYIGIIHNSELGDSSDVEKKIVPKMAEKGHLS